MNWSRNMCIIIISTLLVAVLPHDVRATSRPLIRVQYISLSGISLPLLSSGHDGRGLLIYHYNGRTTPSLAVLLQRKRNSTIATATVYSAVSPSVIRDIVKGQKNLSSIIRPSLKITALNGWWLHDGQPNYNLDVSVYGRIYAMWGSSLNALYGDQGYLRYLGPHELMADIEIRTGSHGRPLWDYRQLVPKFPGMGVYRVNYAQRGTSPSSWRYMPSVSPLWPYVAFSGHFLQPVPNQLNPPIVVDWATGTVTRFSEVVSVRSQANGYDFYSITPWIADKTNHPDFESPWGFYNLSPTPESYPNLIIRTQHFYADDPWSVGDDPKLLLGKPLLDKPEENVRYSWAVHPGNVAFDYKVDVYGFHPYTNVASLAGGTIKVQAPAYQSYPTWVIGHRWPSTTFVESLPKGYQTTEGIYPWAAQGIGTPYWMGWSAHPNLQQFQSIPQGLRGEYRVGINRHPRLYASPIDDRLHLLYAQGGLWNLGHNFTLRENNLDGGPYINQWTLSKRVHGKSSTTAQLAALPGHLVYSSSNHVTIKKASYNPSVFTILPPTSKTTWSQFVAKTATFRQGKNPYDLESWLKGFAGSQVTGRGTIQNIVETSKEFTLTVTGTNAKEWTALLSHPSNFSDPSSTVVLSYSLATHHWSLNSKVLSPVTARITSPASFTPDIPHTIRVTLTNSAPYIQRGTLTVAIDNDSIASKVVTLGPGQYFTNSIAWSPASSGTDHLSILFNHQRILEQTLRVSPVSRPNSFLLWADSLPLSGTSVIVLVLTLAVSGLTLILWRRIA